MNEIQQAFQKAKAFLRENPDKTLTHEEAQNILELFENALFPVNVDSIIDIEK